MRLSLQGHKKREIAEIMDMTTQGIYKALKKYKANGLEGLILGKAKGRERKMTKEQETELYEVISEKLPRDVGLEPFCNLTAPLACKYVRNRFGIKFSERGMRDVFYRLKLSYTRPTNTLEKADSVKQEEFKEKLEGLKKGS